MSIQIFGYGSLINKESLLATTPSATNIRPAIIKGFMRDFSVWDEAGFTETNLDLAGQPYCAVDVRADSDTTALVNGVVFTIPDDELVRLKQREKDYQTIETIAYDFATHDPLGKSLLFISGKNNGKFIKDSPAQQRYYDICCRSAREYGDDFYTMFIATTKISE